MSKKNRNKQQPETSEQEEPEVIQEEEPKKGYEAPIWSGADGEFIKCDKKEFGHSLQGKIDFCKHQIFMYEERMKDLVEEHAAKNDPAKKLKLSIERKRKALIEEESALVKLLKMEKK